MDNLRSVRTNLQSPAFYQQVPTKHTAETETKFTATGNRLERPRAGKG